MTKLKIGFLHPGAMGISLAASAQNSGHIAHWASEGRSQQTHDRAKKYGLVDARTLEELCRTCSVIVSICPPEAAEDVAKRVLACSFRGAYLDANAIAPQRAIAIGQSMEKAGATFVDGGIIGGPAWKPGRTWLYLSGREANGIAGCFSAGPLETSVIGDSVGRASALKMCYAANTKGTTALLYAVLATAEELGVRGELEAHWSRHETSLADDARSRNRSVAARAWRFVGEMEEISRTFKEAGLPGEFHKAAAQVFQRMAGFKNPPEVLPLEDVLEALLRDQKNHAA